MRKKGFSVQTILISPDKHFNSTSSNGTKPRDRHDPRALSCLLQVIKDLKPDWHIGLGDTGHYSYISHWNVDKGIYGRSASEDGETIQSNISNDNNLINRWLDHLQAAMPRGSRMDELEGNHEQILRESRQMPKYSALVNSDWYPEKVWRLKERGINWTTYQPYNGKKNWVEIGKHLKVIHGMYAGTTHLTRHWQAFQSNLIYGHMHTRESRDYMHPVYSSVIQTIGCLCMKEASYHGGRLNAWAQGFSIVYLMPDGRFFDSWVRILDGRCIVDGKTYEAKREGWVE